MIHDAQLDFYGKRLATCSSDKTVKIFDVDATTQQQTLVRELRGHEGPVWEVAWAHPKFGGILASCSYDRKVIIWKETTSGWENVHEHREHKSSVNSIAWAPHESGELLLACGSSDGQISVISPSTDGSGLWTCTLINAHDRGVTSVSWAPAQAAGLAESESSSTGALLQLVSGGCDKLVKVWTRDAGAREWSGARIGDEHADWVRDVAWAPGLGLSAGGLVASCSQAGELYVWQRESDSAMSSAAWTRKQLARFDGVPVWRVSWSVAGNILAVSSADNKVTLWKEGLDGNWERVSEMNDPSS